MIDETVRAEAAEATPAPAGGDMRGVIREVIGEYLQLQKAKSEPAYKAELQEERRKREQLEQRMNELARENEQARRRAEEAERSTAIRGELQKLGVAKVDLAFKAVKDEIVRDEQGRLVAKDASGQTEMKEYLAKFVQENPELLPARVSGGSGATLGGRAANQGPAALDLDRIKPGMDPEELDRLRREIAKVANKAAQGL